MDIFNQNIESKRLLEVFRYLYKEGIVDSQVDFCNKIEYGTSAFNDAIAGNRHIPNKKITNAIRVFNINEDFIYGNSRSMFKNSQIENKNPSAIKKGVPVYNVDFTAGDLTQFSDEPNRVIGTIDLNGFRNCIAFVQVKGSSMYPDFVAGDLIGVEPIPSLEIIEYGQPFAVETKNNQRMIKIIRRGKDDDNLILRSTNKDYDDIHIHKSKIQKLYKVHGPVRDQWQ